MDQDVKVDRNQQTTTNSNSIIGMDSREAGQEERSLTYHLHTIWLFTRNDLISIVCTETFFGLSSALSGPLLTTNSTPSLPSILTRLPLIILWTYLNLLLFDIANQRLPSSILEDKINKPWRPLPSTRLTPASARRLLLLTIPLVVLASLSLGGVLETLAMVALTWMYNDLAGADENYLTRNAINACGFVCYSSGATVVAAGYGQYELSRGAYSWLAIVGAIIFTTLQMQDMADMEGDAARGRRTLPLVHGEMAARWSIAVPVAAWSVICPAFWGLDYLGYAGPVAIGGLLAGRVLLLRTAAEDKTTWKVWCLWTAAIYLLPLCKDHSVFGRLGLPNDARFF